MNIKANTVVHARVRTKGAQTEFGISSVESGAKWNVMKKANRETLDLNQ
jgi:hypothetical protein